MPYLLILPGGLWLVIFFVVPMIFMVSLSTQEGDVVDGFTQTFHFANYGDGLGQYHDAVPALAGVRRVATAVVHRAGVPDGLLDRLQAAARASRLYLFLILLPFFVSFVLRTVSWQYILADNGMVLGPLKSAGLLPGELPRPGHRRSR